MSTKASAKLANLFLLEFVAEKLGDLKNQATFLGGCTTSLLINDENIPDVRYTLDVDCIVDVISLNHYHEIEKALKQLGFKQSITEEIICRWHFNDIILDVMPTDQKILGFGNRWYKDAIRYAISYSLPNGSNINIINAPYFLATKIEAFKTRGKNDFYSSHDFEDIITMLDGNTVITTEINNAEQNVKEYLIDFFKEIYRNPLFSGAIPGHFVQYGNLAEDRIALLEEKILTIISR